METTESNDKYTIQEVPVELGKVIVDNEGKQFTFDQALVEVLNKLARIEELVG